MPTAPRSGRPFRSLFLPPVQVSPSGGGTIGITHSTKGISKDRKAAGCRRWQLWFLLWYCRWQKPSLDGWLPDGCDGGSLWLYVAVEVEGNRKMVPYVSTISTTREGCYSLLSLGRCKIYASQTILITLWCKPASRHHDLWLVVGVDAFSFLSMYNTILSSAPYLSSGPIFIPTRGIDLAGDHTTIRTHSQLFTSSVILNINT